MTPLLKTKVNLTDEERERALSAQQKVSKARNEQHKKDIVDVLSMESGRRVFAAILAEFRLMSTVFDPTSNAMLVKVGKQEAAQHIYRDIVDNAGFDMMAKIWKESMEHEKLEDEKYKSAVGDDLYRKILEMNKG